MKRDMDLIRWLLLQLEARDSFEPVRCVELLPDVDSNTQYTPQEVEYNTRLLIEAGLISGEVKLGTRKEKYRVYIERLTWKGHEFIDAARDETRWNQTKRWLSEKSGGLAYSLLMPLLLQKLREQLGIEP